MSNSLLKKVASAAEAGRKCPLRVKNEAKRRSLHGVNEHFELNFDDASASAVVFQRAAKSDSLLDNNPDGLIPGSLLRAPWA
jgi:hypothetical protein